MLKGHTDSVNCLDFSADASFLATGGLDGQVKVWDCQTGTALHSLEGLTSDVCFLQWHAEKNLCFAGDAAGSAWLWQLKDGQISKSMGLIGGHQGSITAGELRPDGL